MKSAYVLEKKDNYLFVTLSGEYDRVELKSYGKALMDICEKEEVFKVLINMLGITGTNLSVMERFVIGESVAELFPPTLKLAVAWPEKDLTRFAETVAVNRGSFLAVFPTVEEAERWLVTPA